MRKCCDMGRQRQNDRVTCDINAAISHEKTVRDGVWRRIKLKTNTDTNINMKLEEKAGAKVRRLLRCKRSGSGAVIFKRCCTEDEPT